MKSLSPVIARLRNRMKPRRDFPTVESRSCWRDGWYHALPIGLVTGFALAVILFKR